MKLIVFGANGRTGREVVKQALAAGHHVTAFMRQNHGLFMTHDFLEFILGDARNPQDVAEAILGHEAVISIIAPKMGDTKNYDISEIAMRNIVHGMQLGNVKRLIIQSGAWGTEYLEDGHPIGRPLFEPFLKPIYKYKIKEDELVRASGLDWTIVRCALLTPFSLRTKVHVDMERHKTKLWQMPLISRKSVAYFMITILEDRQFYKRCPIIMN